MKRYLTDPRLLLFGVLIVGASIISAHGAWLFFGYLVDPWLAGVFTAVVAVGIIGLDAAGTIERGWRRAPYYTGMIFFIVLETLANYFAGQAGFVSRIQEALRGRPASDLLGIATSDPAATRSLVVLFLSPASLAVALFTFAATKRVLQIRAGADAPLVARLARLAGILRQRRGLIRRLVARLRETRGQLRAARGELASLAGSSRKLADRVDRLVALSRQRRRLVRRLVVDLRVARGSLADACALLADRNARLAGSTARLVGASRVLIQRRGLVVRLSQALREARGQLVGERLRLADESRTLTELRGQFADCSRDLAAARGEVVELRARLAASETAAAMDARELAELRERLAAAVPNRAAIIAYAQQALERGRALDEVARELDFPASTLRSWLQRTTIERNGHVKETA